MKKLQRVTRDTTGGHSLLYLYYEENCEVAKTIDATGTGSVAIDVDEGGQAIGIELLDPGRAELEKLTEIARERELSLDGLFAFA